MIDTAQLSRRDATQPLNEVFKPIAGYEGLYEVSDRGRVKSLNRISAQGHVILERILKPGDSNKWGHLNITLTKKGVQKTFWLHRVVAHSFLGMPGIGEECCHMDGNPRNNYASNLRWGSHQSNVDDMRTHGTLRIGSKNTGTKLSDDDVREIRLCKESGINSAIRYGVSRSHISNIRSLKTRSHVA